MKSSVLAQQLVIQRSVIKQPGLKRLALRSIRAPQTSGYTLIEILVVVLIIAILAAIVSPSYLAWLNNQRVGSVRSQVADAMRKAQNEAKRSKINYELRFDNNNGTPRYAIIPSIDRVDPANPNVTVPARIPNASVAGWQNLIPDGGSKQGLQIRSSAAPLAATDGSLNGGQISGIVFNPYGAVVSTGDPNTFDQTNSRTVTDRGVFTVQVTIGNPTNNQYKRCVVVRTLLGSFREEKGAKCPSLPN